MQLEGPLLDNLLGVLHTADSERPSEQSGGCGAAESHLQIPREPWPGASIGIRAPEPGETAIGYAEIAIWRRLKGLE
jgi:hypothetical protein